MTVNINPLKLQHELEAAGFPVCSVRSVDPAVSLQPVADYTRPLSAQEQDQASAIIQAHDPSPEVQAADEKDQWQAISLQVKNLQSALDLVAGKMTSAGLITADESKKVAGALSSEQTAGSTPIQTVT